MIGTFAYSVIDIAPEKDLPLSGLKHREPNAPHLGIKECNLKIAWLSFSEDQHFLFFLADYLFFPNKLATALTAHLFNDYKIAAENLIFSGTHTHSGPALGFLPWEKEQPEYLDLVLKKIIAELPNLLNKGQAGKLRQGAVEVDQISINRRLPVPYWKRFFKPKALMLPNPQGPVSPWVKVIQFEAEGGEKLWFLSYASHPVFNRNLELSSDYPGLLAQSIKEKGWADEVFVFPGFGGDVRPNYHGAGGFRTWIYGRNFAKYLPKHLQHFNSVIVHKLTDITFSEPIALDAPVSDLQNITLVSESGKTEKKLTLRKLTLGSDLNFLIANAEIFVQYEISLPQHIFTISCTSNCLGYLPTIDQIDIGGYEVEDAPLNNGMDGPISKSSLQSVVEKMAKLIKE